MLAIVAIFLVRWQTLSLPGSIGLADDARGVMGDFFGGILNPILAFLSLIALLYTVNLQTKEMEMTRKELEASRKAQQQAAGEAERTNQLSSVKTNIDVKATLLNIYKEQYKLQCGWNSKSGQPTEVPVSRDTIKEFDASVDKFDGAAQAEIHTYFNSLEKERKRLLNDREAIAGLIKQNLDE